MTYVKKKFDACGKFSARIDGIEVGFEVNCGIAAIIPDDKVTIKNPC